ncbi:Hypothetical protein OINT_1002435 [Brucella intermedia LMG 3301]|uniref:Uncharacterized protein n=1 Tax=Brucella intermedia LMG 3301 TaxID=641118 RepID=C4WKM0_9HYPH|nr:Hypothetical protein OINT_1002435 [Brucella intermedia LMG 3301]
MPTLPIPFAGQASCNSAFAIHRYVLKYSHRSTIHPPMADGACFPTERIPKSAKRFSELDAR